MVISENRKSSANQLLYPKYACVYNYILSSIVIVESRLPTQLLTIMTFSWVSHTNSLSSVHGHLSTSKHIWNGSGNFRKKSRSFVCKEYNNWNKKLIATEHWQRCGATGTFL